MKTNTDIELQLVKITHVIKMLPLMEEYMEFNMIGWEVRVYQLWLIVHFHLTHISNDLSLGRVLCFQQDKH